MLMLSVARWRKLDTPTPHTSDKNNKYHHVCGGRLWLGVVFFSRIISPSPRLETRSVAAQETTYLEYRVTIVEQVLRRDGGCHVRWGGRDECNSLGRGDVLHHNF